MKNLFILLITLVTLSGCEKSDDISIRTPDPNVLQIYIAWNDSGVYLYNVYFTNDSLSFDSLIRPDEVIAGVKENLYNGTYHYYEPIKVELKAGFKYYAIGYRVADNSNEHKFIFVPTDKNKIIELPGTIY